MTRKEILEKNWKDFRLSTGLEYEPMSDKAYEFMENAMEQYAELRLGAVIGSLRFSEREVDFAYLCGVFNASGIDGLHTEIQRLKELGEEPHDIIIAAREQ